MSNSAIYVVDDDPSIRRGLSNLLRSVGLEAVSFESIRAFLESPRPDKPSCLVLDVRLPGQSGLEFQAKMTDLGVDMPIVFITGHGDVPMAVRAMKAGAIEFLTKPFRDQELLEAIEAGLCRDRARREEIDSLADLRERFETLTAREREVMALVVSGRLNKQIAADLDLSEITVKVHRGQCMRKMQAQSLAELVRMSDALQLERKR